MPGGTHGGFLAQVIPDGFGAHFATSGAPFYAFSTTNSTDTDVNGNQAWDWGYTLVPEDSLTPQVLIGLGIGRDPTSGTNPNENGNPIWVTPVGNGDTFVTVYVDFDANPATGAPTDINGNKYDTLVQPARATVKITTPAIATRWAPGLHPHAPAQLAAAWADPPPPRAAARADVGTESRRCPSSRPAERDALRRQRW